MVIQIVLESLPVSSSGHVSLLEHYFEKKGYLISLYPSFFIPMPNTVFDYFTHGPTVFIITLFFFHRWFFLLKHLRKTFFIFIKGIKLIVVADSVTIIFFLLFNVIGKAWLPLCLGFFISGCALFSLYCCPKDVFGVWSWRKAVVLGAVQGIAFLPGISRFALTYVTARWLSLSWKKAFEISLLIQWPLITIGFLHSVYILFNHHLLFQLLNIHSLLVMLGASIIAFFALCFVWYAAKAKKVWLFSFYLFFISFVCLLFI